MKALVADFSSFIQRAHLLAILAASSPEKVAATPPFSNFLARLSSDKRSEFTREHAIPYIIKIQADQAELRAAGGGGGGGGRGSGGAAGGGGGSGGGGGGGGMP